MYRWAATKKLYISLMVTPAPVWIAIQWLLVLSLTLVVGKAENFSPCPHRLLSIGFVEADEVIVLYCIDGVVIAVQCTVTFARFIVLS